MLILIESLKNRYLPRLIFRLIHHPNFEHFKSKTEHMRFCLPLFLLFFALPCFSQYRDQANLIEAGVMLGITSYSGDISAKRVDLQEIRPGYGAFVRYHLNPHFALKGHVYAGAISGDDKYSSTKAPRSFKFGTSIFEVATTLEWHLFSRHSASGTGLRNNFSIDPYAYAGVGITFADADAQYYGPPDQRDKFLVVPLPEEGLKSKFLLAPVGGGIRINVLDNFILGLEGGFRPVFSDDIDGVSLNGNPKQNDWYYFFGATASFVLNGGY